MDSSNNTKRIAIPKVDVGGLSSTITTRYEQVSVGGFISTAHYPRSGILEIREV